MGGRGKEWNARPDVVSSKAVEEGGGEVEQGEVVGLVVVMVRVVGWWSKMLGKMMV